MTTQIISLVAREGGGRAIGVISLRKGETKVIPVRVTPSGKGLSTPHPRGGGVPLRLSDIRDF